MQNPQICLNLYIQLLTPTDNLALRFRTPRVLKTKPIHCRLKLIICDWELWFFVAKLGRLTVDLPIYSVGLVGRPVSVFLPQIYPAFTPTPPTLHNSCCLSCNKNLAMACGFKLSLFDGVNNQENTRLQSFPFIIEPPNKSKTESTIWESSTRMDEWYMDEEILFERPGSPSADSWFAGF